MSNVIQAAQCRWRNAFSAIAFSAGVLVGWPHPAAAHDLFTAYVQHRAQMTVGARHIDLKLELTFFEEWSGRERRAMDADANGRITRPELESYLKKLAPRLAHDVKLRIAGREVESALLYEPEVDLLGDEQAGPGHHRLRLVFFAPTPAALKAGEEIVVEDRLWPDAKALGTVQSEGLDGCTLTTENPSGLGLAPARPDVAQVFKVRCLKPPQMRPGAANAPLTSPPPAASKPRNFLQRSPPSPSLNQP